jgi:hypothetical protein
MTLTKRELAELTGHRPATRVYGRDSRHCATHHFLRQPDRSGTLAQPKADFGFGFHVGACHGAWIVMANAALRGQASAACEGPLEGTVMRLDEK